MARPGAERDGQSVQPGEGNGLGGERSNPRTGKAGAIRRNWPLDDAVELVEKKVASSLSKAERLELVERTNSELAVMGQCELLSLQRSTVYYVPRGVNV